MEKKDSNFYPWPEFHSVTYPKNSWNQQCSAYVRQGSKALIRVDLLKDVSKPYYSEYLQSRGKKSVHVI